MLIGLSGAQGSGKSTTAARLANRLGAVVLSIDDFYLTRAERQALARTVHPLLATRGVPGTHDLGLAERAIRGLLNSDAAVPLPRFDKTRDDRAPESSWPVHSGGAEVVVLEGWCLGARPQPEAALVRPVNALEREEDPDGTWRGFVNAKLEGPYRKLFESFDLGFLLRAPSFDQVFAWRAEQERELERTSGSLQPMDDQALRRFIAHYERLTRWILQDEPVDLVIPLGPDRAPLGWRPGRRNDIAAR